MICCAVSNFLPRARGLGLAFVIAAAPAGAAVIGQVDDFEAGTTQGWVVGLLGAVHPAPPENIASGGPLGAGDAYLKLTAVGGAGAGNRLAAINLTQWAGNYTSLGLTQIGMDLRNFGATDLNIRLYLENPLGGPPTDTAVTAALALPAGGDWTHADFALDPASLTLLTGNLGTLLSNVTALRIFHGPTAGFPGPPVIAMLGVDNITAVPLPGAAGLAIAAVCGMLGFSRRRNRD
jgi:hypothetical protein